MDHAVTSMAQLRELYPPPAERSLRKQLDHLDVHCRDFIARSPFVLLASASAAGACDVSPKGGPPGFVRVLDDRRLAIPDATGNRRLDSLANLLENPQAGLLFLIPRLGETLRVNGRATLSTDPELLRDAQTGGRAAVLSIVVEAEEVYLHCAKCILRSQLWEPGSWADEVPSAAEIYRDHIGFETVEQSAEMLAESYRTQI